MLKFSKHKTRWTVVKIVAIYAIFSCVWIYLSDTMLWLLTQNPVILTRISIFKGFLFILITSTFLYRLFTRYALQINESNAQLQKQAVILENLAEGVNVCNDDGIISYTNKTLDIMFGYDKEELIGKHVTILHNKIPEDNKQFFTEIDAKLSGEGIVSVDLENLKKDGSVFYTRAHISTLEVSGKKYWITVQEDITERKHMEASLLDSETRLRTILENSLDVAYKRNLQDDIYDYISPAIEKLTGFTTAEFGGMSLDDMLGRVHPDDRSHLLKEFEKSFISGYSPNVLEYRFKCKNNEYRWLADTFTLQKSEDGSLLFRIGNVRDVTERKKDEEALLKSEERFRTLASATFEGIAITEKGRFVDVNDQFASMLGYERDELIGIGVESVISHEDRASVMANIMEGRESNIEHIAICKDGSQRIVEAHGKSIEQHGRHLRLTAVNDITERKRAEEALKVQFNQISTTFDELNAIVYIAELETNKLLFVNKYGALLCGSNWQGKTCYDLIECSSGIHPCEFAHTDRLLLGGEPPSPLVHEYQHKKTGRWYQAREKVISWTDGSLVRMSVSVDITDLKDLDRLKDDMISSVSHEMRTPLTAIAGYIEFLLENKVDEAQLKEYLRIVHNQNERLIDLISDFLDLQRLNARQSTSGFQLLQLQSLLEEAVTFFSGTSALHKILLDSSGDLPPVYGDAKQLQHALANLLSNAIRYSPKGGEVVLGARREQDDSVVLYVKDEGIGVPTEVREKIFEKFYQVDMGDIRKSRGTGLGLALVREIVEAHGGRAWVESEVGKGSTFYISLPSSTEKHDAEATDQTFGKN